MGVRKAKLYDLEEVARIHKARFSKPDYLLGQYSARLVRNFYASFLNRAEFLVNDSSGRVDGFILGGMPDDLRACKRSFLRTNMPRCVLETAWRPRVWPHSVQTLMRLARSRHGRTDMKTGNIARLLAFAIDNGNRNGGAAMSLIEAFERQLQGVCSGYQGTVREYNTQLLRFFQYLGLDRIAGSGGLVTVRKSFAASP